ncbi:MAG: hypothetical protein JW881_02435 [Spirochaetales bacterium]|nr:hypothetical protein [Spirochaetales bacterium]
MGKFLSRHKERIVELFSQIVEIGIEKDLINFDVLAIDTVKIRANASYKRFKTLSGMKEERRKIRERIKELIEKTDEESTIEQEMLEKRKATLEAGVKALKKRIEEEGAGRTETEKNKLEEKMKINMIDSDCSLLQ